MRPRVVLLWWVVMAPRLTFPQPLGLLCRGLLRGALRVPVESVSPLIRSFLELPVVTPLPLGTGSTMPSPSSL